MRIALVLGTVACAALAHAPRPAVTGLDHVPIAVGDLARAADDYRALGFTLKPGRPHDDGIENQHVKFSDGTELELITAPEARDALTTTYRRHLEHGDGPAFLALFAPDLGLADARLNALKTGHARSGGAIDFAGEPALGYLFLGGRNKSPTDLPQHFAHANTAESLIRVWLAGDDLSRERRLLEGLGLEVELPAEEFPGYKGDRIVCAECEEGINFRREIQRDGRVLCRSCGGESYYKPL